MPDANNTIIPGSGQTNQLCFPFVSTMAEYGLQEFVPGDNHELLHILHTLITRTWNGCLYLWGGSGTGKSHLLRAVCLEAAAHQARCAYLRVDSTDMENVSSLASELKHDIVCLDGVDQLAACDEEPVLFLYEQLRAINGVLLVTARQNIPALPLRLDDLRSRFQWGLNYQLKPLNDAGRLTALQQRVRSHALSVPDSVLRYLMERTPRGTCELFASLDILIREAGRCHKPLTTRFIQQYLNKTREASSAGARDITL